MTQVQDFTHHAYVNYFEQIAREHHLLKHSETQKRFYRINIEEFLDDQVNWAGDGAVMLLESPTTFVEGARDNYSDAITGAFMILKKVKNVGDYDEENCVLDTCKKIGWDIISRLLKDGNDDSDDNDSRPFKLFMPERVQAEKVGRAHDNEYGYRFTFVVLDPLDLSYDEEKWITD